MAREREQLVEQYRAAVNVYGQAVSAMDGLTGVDFEQARQNAKAARIACEDCRMALETYDLEHPRDRSAHA